MISLRRYITHSLGRSLKIQPLTTIVYHHILATQHISLAYLFNPLAAKRAVCKYNLSNHNFLKYKNQLKSPIDKIGHSIETIL